MSNVRGPPRPPSSLLGKAIGYLLNHQLALTRFLDDGRLPIDNGIIERLHRRPAVGRRNYLFAGSHEGAKRAAIAYSLCATCNLLEIDPVAYLADVLLRSPEASPSPRSGPSRPRRGRTVNKPDQERPGDYVTRRHESTRA
ncbi:MAG: transposase [Polyangiaceae bacterium]|nr:transposase [Polyangiaceae bacterium]